MCTTESCRARALRETSTTIRGYGFTVPAVLWFLVGSIIHERRVGLAAMLDEWSVWVSYTLPIAAFAILLFLWNLALAPYRNARDERDCLSVQVADLSDKILSFKDSRNFQEKLREMADRLQRFSIDYNAARPAAKDNLNFGFSESEENEWKIMGVDAQGNTAINKNTDQFQLRMIMNLQNERQSYENKWWTDFGHQFGGNLHELLKIAADKKIIEGPENRLLVELENEYSNYRRPDFYNEMATLLRKIASRAEADIQRRIS